MPNNAGPRRTHPTQPVPRRSLPGQALRLLLFWILALVALAGCRPFETLESSARQVWQQVRGARNEAEPVRASGTIQADEVRIASEFGGRIEEVFVRAGDPVSVGDALVALDAAPLVDKLAEAEAAVAAAQADLAALLAELRPEERAVAQAAVSIAEAEREGAQLALENARREWENPQALDAQIIDAQTRERLAEQAAVLAEAEVARVKLLAQQKREGTDERRIADYQVVAAEKALAAAQADRVAVKTLLDWLTYIRREPLATIARVHGAEADVRLAENQVGVAQARLRDLESGPTPQQVAVARARIRLAQAQSGVLRTQIEQHRLLSPLEGLVLSQVLDKGELAAPAAAILVIADLDPVTLTVYVPVNQIGRIDLGQEVRVQVDAYPGQAFGGRVSHIGDEPEFTPRNIATQEERLNTFYPVQIALENPGHLLKPGMPADAVFVGSEAGRPAAVGRQGP